MSNVLQVKILDDRLKNDPDFQAPSFSSDGSAGIDLRVLIDEDTTLKAGESKKFGTGLAFYLKDKNYVGLVYPRSGLGSKHGIVLGNLTGVIDADYQGELILSLWNRSDEDYVISVGERVAQYIVTPILRPQIQIVCQFDDQTERGAGGFGSSGK